jgi:hypothetical protein
LIGWYVVAQVAQAQSIKQGAGGVERRAAQPADAADADTDEDADDAAEQPAERQPPPVAARPMARATSQKPAMPRNFETMGYLWLCIAGLIAYELGRGTGAATATGVETEPEPTGAPAGAHPDA